MTLVRSLQELKSYLAEGVSMDELWQVAKGQKKYAEFAQQRKGGEARPQPPPLKRDTELPDDVVSIALIVGSGKRRCPCHCRVAIAFSAAHLVVMGYK